MNHEEQPPVPDEVWQRFLRDSEHAIRRTAPREPSARERAATAEPGSEDTAAENRAEAVGELWRPQPESATWRALDGRARRRRALRLLAAAAVAAAALATLSRLPSDPRPLDDRHGGVVLQESEDAPTDRPTAEATTTAAGFIPPPP